MRKWLLGLMLLLTVGVQGQTLTAKEWDKIQKSGDYIIGMGMGESMDHARQVAMGDLVGKISSKVESQFEYLITNKDNKLSEGRMEKIIRTYSSAKLDNVSEHIAKNHDKYVVYRYMKNSELRAMFKRRIAMAKNWVKEAIQLETENKIGDALQDFYWSLALLRSCPDGDLETFDTNQDKSNMMMDVQRRVRDILENITVKAVSTEKDGYSQRLTLKIKYKGQPVVNFNYKYFDGKHYSDTYSAKDGMGTLLLPPNAKLKKVKIYAEYEFRDEANIQPELQSVMETLDPVPFRAAMLTVDTRDCPLVNSSDYVMMIAGQGQDATPLDETSEASEDICPDSRKGFSVIRAVETGLAQRSYARLESYFTPEGWDMFCKLVKYGEAQLLKSPEVKIIPNGNGMVCRSFPMSFKFKANKRVFTEDVVFYLNSEGKICEVAFGLEQAAVDDIMNRSDWSEESRQVMIHFLETYKTAYALKRLDYISSIFSNEALIITGSIVKGTKQTEMSPAKQEHVKYTRQTKAQYMKNLERCFNSNEYINLHFADNIVRRSHANTNIYGIQIKQDYYSSSYGDTGYLFLLIDFKRPETPIIHVRTWQPDDDPNVKDGRIGIADFTGLEQL